MKSRVVSELSMRYANVMSVGGNVRPGFSVAIGGSLQREISPLVDVAAVTSVLRLIRRFRPHILHTHTAKAGAVGRTAAMLAARTTITPTTGTRTSISRS